MVRMITVVLIVVCAGWIIWRRWGRGHLPTAPVPSGHMPRETLAFEAFMRGNFCLREGQFTEARAAFHQARELDPKLPYVVARLDEVERQQAGGAPNYEPNGFGGPVEDPRFREPPLKISSDAEAGQTVLS